MFAQIAQEKIPFGRSPAFLRRVIKVEISRKRCDPIEFLTKVRQRFKRVDSPNLARNLEELEQFGKKRDVLDVLAQNGMAKVLGDKQEKTSAATKFENALWLRAMEF